LTVLGYTGGNMNKISVRGCRVHNLKNINVDIPKNKFVVITGLSGSGKSSLAFDTIYAEGQRRYVESLSSYARQFLEVQDKPDVDEIIGLSPTIAIDQKTSSSNPRSTVGTITDIYDYLRLLYARVGIPHCPNCGEAVKHQSREDIAKKIIEISGTTGVMLLAPLIRGQKGEHRQVREAVRRAKFPTIGGSALGGKDLRFDGDYLSLDDIDAAGVDASRKHDIDVVVAAYGAGSNLDYCKLLPVIDAALDWGNGIIILHREDSHSDHLLGDKLICPKCGVQLPKIEPQLFSFNSPRGACPECAGLGKKLVIEPELVIPNKKLTLAQGAIKPWTRIAGNQQAYARLLEAVAARHQFSIHEPVGALSKKAADIIFFGTADEEYPVNGRPEKYEGIIKNLEIKYKETDSDYIRHEIENYMREVVCPACLGKRLKPELLAVTIADKNISDIVNLPVKDAYEYLSKILPKMTVGKNPAWRTAEQKIAAPIIKEVLVRLKNILEIGLGYLSLDRSAVTLSGGEAQRVRLSTQITSSLSGVIYILDEPSIGLHPYDDDRLIGTLKKLRDQGNTILVVEHDRAAMLASDYLIDVGPGAGEYGGKIIAAGSIAQVKQNKNSLTGAYLAGKAKIETPKTYRRGSGKKIVIHGASEFNLRNIDVEIPLGKLVCVAGLSGSGKSTLIIDILGKALAKEFYGAKDEPGAHKNISGMRNINKVITIDQSPIGRTPRSNPATYTGVFTAIRDLFAEIPEAKMRGFDAGKFSFNVRGGGRCETCGGEGFIRTAMQFLPDVFIECRECRGKRYNAEALEIKYRERTIADVLDMSVEEARQFFADILLIYDKLTVLHQVGLGYIKLGQPANNLSGGEAQRVKLATELSRRDTGHTLYILDEPTTGLHFEDIKRLLGVLNQLVDRGNTILVIEHNLDVIKTADWIIDLGPEGGAAGGCVIAEGTPKTIAKHKKSHTGAYLKKMKI